MKVYLIRHWQKILMLGMAMLARLIYVDVTKTMESLAGFR
jgi:hypothetical protein